MRYSYEYKRKCVEMYRTGQWPDTPTGIKEKSFRIMIWKWAKMSEANDPEVLQHKSSNKTWTPEERLELVMQVTSGKSIKSVAIQKRRKAVCATQGEKAAVHVQKGQLL